MRAVTALFTMIIALAATSPAAAVVELLHQQRSLYRTIFITQNGDQRCMTFRYPRSAGRQSCKLMHDPDKLVFAYTRMLLSGLILNPNPRRILIIGEGGGTMPSALQAMFPDARIDVVELDEAVDAMARTYFGFRPGPRTRVFISDGRIFVKRVAAQQPDYDLVMLDAFEADYIPEHMLTREFLREVAATMAPKGVIVANTFSNSVLYDHESATYRDVFGPFFNLKLDNRIVLGRKGGIAPNELAGANWNGAALKDELRRRGTSSDALLKLMNPATDWDPASRVLTDQYSPSNLLNAIPRP